MKPSTRHPVQEFIERVRFLHEPEYGDFKRKVGLYLRRMSEGLEPAAKRQIADVLRELHEQVVFCPSGDVESTRAETLARAEQILKRLNLPH